MKKNAFTLIELIGVIVVIALLSVIVVPSIMRVMLNAKNEAYNNQVKYIEQSAEKWSIYNINKLSKTSTYYLSVNTLLSEGYIDGDDIKDPRNIDNTLNGCVAIKYDSAYSQYTFEYKTSGC